MEIMFSVKYNCIEAEVYRRYLNKQPFLKKAYDTMKIAQRVLEAEAMMSLEEVIAYDLLTLKYLMILHAGFVETVVNFSPAKGRFLEIGTGTGRISINIATYAPSARIEAVDLSETMLKVARRNAKVSGVENRIIFKLGDAKHLPYEDRTFDAVYCHNMLHHIPEPLALIQEMKRVTKPGGAFLVRDLIRIPQAIIPLHVYFFGMPYTELMKKEYKDSIMAALSEEEWKILFDQTKLPNARISKQFLTHQSMERPADKRRADYVAVPVPFYLRFVKNFYVSSPSE